MSELMPALEWNRQSETGCSNCREAVKMVLLLPLLIPRMLVIVAALLFMATCSYIGGLGWCVGFAMRTKYTLYRTRGLIEKQSCCHHSSCWQTLLCMLRHLTLRLLRFDSEPAQPLPPLRRAVVVAGSKATKVILAMLGVWVRVRGWDNVESGRRQHAVVIFNHVSFVSGHLHRMAMLFAPFAFVVCTITFCLLQALVPATPHCHPPSNEILPGLCSAMLWLPCSRCHAFADALPRRMRKNNLCFQWHDPAA
jgi:hypothetical protein